MGAFILYLGQLSSECIDTTVRKAFQWVCLYYIHDSSLMGMLIP